jgi:hypothetical protein
MKRVVSYILNWKAALPATASMSLKKSCKWDPNCGCLIYLLLLAPWLVRRRVYDQPAAAAEICQVPSSLDLYSDWENGDKSILAAPIR